MGKRVGYGGYLLGHVLAAENVPDLVLVARSARRISHRSVWRFTLVWRGPSTWILRGKTDSIGSSYGSVVYKFAENTA
jgi:hypothetical protein